jgi:hypothetical protein
VRAKKNEEENQGGEKKGKKKKKEKKQTHVGHQDRFKLQEFKIFRGHQQGEEQEEINPHTRCF